MTDKSKHPPTICRRINSSADFHGRSWSYRHACQVCGATQRRNANFLGSRYELVCDGARISPHRKGDPCESTVIVGTLGAIEATVTAYPAKAAGDA